MYEVFDRNDTKEQISMRDWDRVVRDLHIEEAAVSDAGKRVLKRLITEYSDIFSKNEDDIGKTNILKHHISTGDAEPGSPAPAKDSAKTQGGSRKAEKQNAEGGHHRFR